MTKFTRNSQTTHGSTKQSGYSLIEVLIATAILTSVLLGVAQLFIWTTKQNLSSDDLTRCAALANERIEELRSTRDFSGFTLAGPGYTDSFTEANLLLDTGEHSYSFERITTVTQIVEAGVPMELYHVTVRVQALHEGARLMYMAKDGRGRKVQMEVLLAG